MLEGVQNVLGRIQQIESNFQARTAAPSVSFGQYLQQAQGSLAGASFNPAAPGMTPGTQSYLQNVNPALWNMLNPTGASTSCPAGSVRGAAIEQIAANQNGRQYWSNACAHAVNDVLEQAGIDIAPRVNNNPEWVPNYADLGQKVTSVADMRPGDLVIYNNYLGEGGYDHIGIYAGDGTAWNVSTAHGHKWVKTPIGSRFQEGRRITAN